MGSKITHGKMFDLPLDDPFNGKVGKLYIDKKNIFIINKNTPYQLGRHMAQRKADDGLQKQIRCTSRKVGRDLQHVSESWEDLVLLTWIDNIQKLKINLQVDATPLKSSPRIKGPRTRAVAKSDENKKLMAGVIEYVISECAALVMFTSKRTKGFASVFIKNLKSWR